MRLSVTLPAEANVAAKAASEGLTVSAYVRRCIRLTGALDRLASETERGRIVTRVGFNSNAREYRVVLE